jgi:tRNA-specific 2-thiouridylase
MASESNLKEKVYIGLSGGVDSAVSAFLLKQKGYDVTGVFIKTWQPDYIECTSKEDRLDAMRVCSQLDIPFITLDLEEEYKKHVIDYFLDEYSKGRIPNPDVMCNKEIKFGKFLEVARAAGARLATGHYAKIQTPPPSPLPAGEGGERNNNHLDYILKIPTDTNKDQTYFLYQIKKEDLKDIIFPLAELTKQEVRQIAKEQGLYVAEKKDSQGICMLGGEIDVKEFLKRELNTKEGKVLNEEGKVIGTHDGAILYTIGERHGFHIHKHEGDTATLPYFIYAKDIESNTLSVTQNENKLQEISSLQFKNGLILQNVNLLINIQEINENKIYKCMTRYRGVKVDVKLKIEIVPMVENDENGGSRVENVQVKILPVDTNLAPIPGQSVVVYDGEYVLLGGIV